MRPHPGCVATATVLALAVTAIDLHAQQHAIPDLAALREPVPYRLAPGDVVDVKFGYNPELNETVTLRPDGCISLQRIGDIHAASLTPLELASRVNDHYATVVRHPASTVIVKDFASQKAYVGGEVAAPGTVELRGRVTALQAILKTGGLRPWARTNQVILVRYSGDQRAEVRKLDLKRVLNGRDEDPLLSPFDVVFVPRSAIGNVALFVDQYINSVIPRSLMFPYNLNTVVTVK